jgi:hypothetical protein
MLCIVEVNKHPIWLHLWLTVCLGGTLEWPPGVVTSTLTSKYPFSVMPGIAKTDPYFSENPPAG